MSLKRATAIARCRWCPYYCLDSRYSPLSGAAAWNNLHSCLRNHALCV